MICVYTYAKVMVIGKPRTLNGGGEDLAAAILLFIGKNIITW